MISAVIVNYNCGAYLKQCVSSILRAYPDASVIVVDNASTDESLSVLLTSFSNDCRVEILRNERNLGFAAACNRGARLAREPFLLYLNPDCLIDETTVPALLDALKEHPDAGMVGGLLLNTDGTEQVGGRRAIPTPRRTLVRVFNLSWLARRYPILLPDFNLQQQPLPDGPTEVDAISGACMLVRREALEDVGGFDEGYFLHCEDLDWCMRFRQKAWKVLFVADARVIHQQGGCSRLRPVFVEWHKHRGMMRFYRKHLRRHYPEPLMWLVAAAVWLRFAGLALYHTTRRIPRWLRRSHA